MAKIYCEVRSGLGNQLFQFAFGYALAREFNRELILCPTFFDSGLKYTLKKILGREVRSFRLRKIIKEPFNLISEHEIKEKLAGNAIRVLSESEVNGQDIRRIIARHNEDIYLKGYWQQPTLFSKIHQSLVNMIGPSFKLSSVCQKMLDRIDENFVGIHVRRGDFLTNRSFGACTIDYYKAAMRRMSDLIGTPKFVVFTNDKQWVNNNFEDDFSYEVYTNPANTNTDVEELYLMTKFKHFIIANSTFSWWGAYLNATPDKFITAPANWFIKSELQNNVNHFNSKDWTVIDNRLELKN